MKTHRSLTPRLLRGGFLLFAFTVLASGLWAQGTFDHDAFLSRKKWYLTFTVRLKGKGDFNQPDRQGGYSNLEWNIDREVTGMVELGTAMPGQFPTAHFAKDPAALMAALAEPAGRFIGWTTNSPATFSNDRGALQRGEITLEGNPLFSPVTYQVNDTVRTDSLSYGEAHAAFQASELTTIQGSGTAFMTPGALWMCDLKEMMFELHVEGARAAVGFRGETPSVKTQRESHSYEESLGESDDKFFPPQSGKPDRFLPGMTESMKEQLLWRKLEVHGETISFTVSEPVAKFPFGFTQDKKGGPPLALSIDVALMPGPPSRAKLMLASQAYNGWRPKCSNSESSKGNDLNIDWRLEEEGAELAAPTKVARVLFALQNTSREPGVCLNYPIHPKTPADFDLKFAEASRSGYLVSPDGQKLTLSGAQVSARKGSVTVDCFDSGAWSDLSVTAELEDGRTLTGHLDSDPSGVVVRLPKRTGNSYIADAWKTEHRITAGDLDDSEKSPSPGKPPGDGFTLYEEYRGFFENGKYFEGDPNKIDFFVRNYIGGDARPGIDRFAQLTEAAVHDRLNDTEFDPGKRVMNANHRQGPHRANQHGVFLRTEAGLNGAEARFTTAGMRGRPRLCTGIFVQPRGAQTPTSTSENVPAADLVSIYDQFVVHELLHTVGVEHHGQRDYHLSLWLIFSDSPANPTGKPYFQVSGQTVTVIDERTGRDLAAMLEPDLLVARDQLRPIVARHMEKSSPAEFEVLLNFFLGTYFVYVGAQQGECSGVEGCLMRYYFAKLYEKKGVPNSYYFIGDKQTERAGLVLCRSPGGTGINAPARTPRPRYGDSKAGWGDCADRIVFNDAAPLESSPQP